MSKLSRTLGSALHSWGPGLLSLPTHLVSMLPTRGLALALVAGAALASGAALYLHPGLLRLRTAATPSPSTVLAEPVTREEPARRGYLVNRGGAPPTRALQSSSRGGGRPNATPTPTSQRKEITAYQVVEGDTVTGLAERFGISAETIAWANSLAGEGATLEPGQELSILPVTGVLHRVGQSETLNGLAKAYSVEPAAIVEANAIEDPDTLGIGQSLLIPGGRPLPSPTPRPTAQPQPSATDAPQAAMASSEATDKGAEIVSIAARYLGCPYVYGGSSPSGFDCSGFAQYVYAQAGISIPRSSAQQATAGSAVSRDALLPGDLVVFQGTYGAGVSHVGIYVGDGRMIHSSTPGRGVCYDALDDAYWMAHYYGARRPW